MFHMTDPYSPTGGLAARLAMAAALVAVAWCGVWWALL